MIECSTVLKFSVQPFHSTMWKLILF